MVELTDIDGVGPSRAEELQELGYETVADVAEADPEDLQELSRVSDDSIREFILHAENLAEEESGEEFDLTPADVSDEVEDESEDDEPYTLNLSFANRLEYDTFHAALMRHHEDVYSSNQPAADVMDFFLDGLDNFSSVSYEVDAFDINTLHNAVKGQRVDYQGDNMINHMEALQSIENQVNELREEKLF